MPYYFVFDRGSLVGITKDKELYKKFKEERGDRFEYKKLKKSTFAREGKQTLDDAYLDLIELHNIVLLQGEASDVTDGVVETIFRLLDSMFEFQMYYPFLKVTPEEKKILETFHVLTDQFIDEINEKFDDEYKFAEIEPLVDTRTIALSKALEEKEIIDAKTYIQRKNLYRI